MALTGRCADFSRCVGYCLLACMAPIYDFRTDRRGTGWIRHNYRL